MCEIPLTQGQVALVDDEDFERVNQFKWCAAYDTSTKAYYATHGVLKNGRRTSERMHRFILNNPADQTIDHINHNTLDNRKENLRACTTRENHQNTLRNTSGYPGVCWNKKVKKWQAAIQISGISRTLGVFHSKEEAYAAYKRVADAQIEIARATTLAKAA